MTYMSSNSANDGSYTLTVTFSIETDPDTGPSQCPEPRRPGVAEAAGGGQASGRHHGEEVDQHADGGVGLFARGDLRRHLSLELFEHQFARQLARVDGVASVEILGARDYGMRIWLEPDRLTASG